MDAEALADAIVVMARDAELRKEYGNSGRAYVVANHSYARIVKMLEKVLNEAVGTHHG